jgi:hypothetical protein
MIRYLRSTFYVGTSNPSYTLWCTDQKQPTNQTIPHASNHRYWHRITISNHLKPPKPNLINTLNPPKPNLINTLNPPQITVQHPQTIPHTSTHCTTILNHPKPPQTTVQHPQSIPHTSNQRTNDLKPPQTTSNQLTTTSNHSRW